MKHLIMLACKIINNLLSDFISLTYLSFPADLAAHMKSGAFYPNRERNAMNSARPLLPVSTCVSVWCARRGVSERLQEELDSAPVRAVTLMIDHPSVTRRPAPLSF